MAVSGKPETAMFFYKEYMGPEAMALINFSAVFR